jgi:hypothetical protein
MLELHASKRADGAQKQKNWFGLGFLASMSVPS